MEVGVVGTGYVGLVSGTCFADLGVTVTCVDTDAAKLARLESTHGLGHRGLLRDRSVVERAAEFLSQPVERAAPPRAALEPTPVALNR